MVIVCPKYIFPCSKLSFVSMFSLSTALKPKQQHWQVFDQSFLIKLVCDWVLSHDFPFFLSSILIQFPLITQIELWLTRQLVYRDSSFHLVNQQHAVVNLQLRSSANIMNTNRESAGQYIDRIKHICCNSLKIKCCLELSMMVNWIIR